MNSKFAGVKVLLLEGFARQSMPMMKALHQLGVHLTTYNDRRSDLGFLSRYPDRKLLEFWDRKDEKASLQALIRVLKENKFDIVIPMTDFSATLLSKHKETLSPYAAMAVNDWNIFQMAGDKLNTMKVCQARGLPCPKTLEQAESIEDILASGLPFPFIIKPRVGYGSIGFHCIHNEAELRKIFPEAREKHGPMLVQEYIPQTGLQYKTEVFIGRDGEICSGVVFDKTRWFPIDGGSTCCSTSVTRPDILQTSCELLQAMGWRGYGDVDLIEDPRDHVAKVMEVNPRITASVKVCFASGVDFARQIVEHEMGFPISCYSEYQTGITLRYMHTDLLWFLKSPRRFQSNPSWFKFTRTTDQIFSIDDPLPWFGYTLQAILKYTAEMNKRKR